MPDTDPLASVQTALAGLRADLNAGLGGLNSMMGPLLTEVWDLRARLDDLATRMVSAPFQVPPPGFQASGLTRALFTPPLQDEIERAHVQKTNIVPVSMSGIGKITSKDAFAGLSSAFKGILDNPVRFILDSIGLVSGVIAIEDAVFGVDDEPCPDPDRPDPIQVLEALEALRPGGMSDDAFAALTAEMLKMVAALPVRVHDQMAVLLAGGRAGFAGDEARAFAAQVGRLTVASGGNAAAIAPVAAEMLTAFDIQPDQWTAAFGDLYAAQQHSGVTLEALLHGFSGVAETVADSGVAFDNYLASIAAMTDDVTPPEELHTRFGRAIEALTEGGGALDAVFEAAGVSDFKQLMAEANGDLLAAFERLRHATHDIKNPESEALEALKATPDAYDAIMAVTAAHKTARDEILDAMDAGRARLDAATAARRRHPLSQGILDENQALVEALRESLGAIYGDGDVRPPSPEGILSEAEMLDRANRVARNAVPVQAARRLGRTEEGRAVLAEKRAAAREAELDRLRALNEEIRRRQASRDQARLQASETDLALVAALTGQPNPSFAHPSSSATPETASFDTNHDERPRPETFPTNAEFAEAMAAFERNRETDTASSHQAAAVATIEALHVNTALGLDGPFVPPTDDGLAGVVQSALDQRLDRPDAALPDATRPGVDGSESGRPCGDPAALHAKLDTLGVKLDTLLRAECGGCPTPLSEPRADPSPDSPPVPGPRPDPPALDAAALGSASSDTLALSAEGLRAHGKVHLDMTDIDVLMRRVSQAKGALAELASAARAASGGFAPGSPPGGGGDAASRAATSLDRSRATNLQDRPTTVPA
ncbi:phage tail tape measure protein [Roseospira visakhapatnamensis]|uniref:Phage tail tape measure protein domain-containing protein n=1 Tax=Roseospira visakhapatnamensis TaxID=390880 RepID=A0A7W6WB14_9PROT|nr:phage tail tape measure protein [Roseospira visakhapatnamensis]MBB4267363.1 hypothetical protein [Roseospira visakhapatnamensis]